MKFCNNCGKELIDGTLFCPECGAPVREEYGEDFAIKQEKECLDTFHRFLRYERTAWRILGILLVVFSILHISLAINGTSESVGLDVFMDIIYLSTGIVNLYMARKVNLYMNTLYNDVDPIIERYKGAGIIVLGAFFNELAMIFIIINFARAKSNKYILRRASRRQRNFYSGK